jgi:hypothetical protein
MDTKEILRLISHPMLMAAAGGWGGKYANDRYKMKMNPWIAGLGGAALGYVVGKGIQGMIPAPAPVETQNQVAPPPPRQPTMDLSFDDNGPPRQLPAPPQYQPYQQSPVESQNVAMEEGNGVSDEAGGIFEGGFGTGLTDNSGSN